MEQDIKKPREVKQVIVMRKDLKMRKGKMIAQGAHASLGALLKFFDKQEANERIEYSIWFNKGSILDTWLNGIFTKICVSVDTEEDLEKLKDQCEAYGIPCALITDCGLTEFHDVPTKTCLGIGPWFAEEIDKVTGKLPLL